MPCMKRVYRNKKKHRSTGRQPGRKSASRLGDKPRINRGWTGYWPRVNRGFCSSIGLHRISLDFAYGKTFRRRVFDALEGSGDPCLLGKQFCWYPVLPDPRPATPPCAPTRPARGMSGFWTRQVMNDVFLSSARRVKNPDLPRRIVSASLAS